MLVCSGYSIGKYASIIVLPTYVNQCNAIRPISLSTATQKGRIVIIQALEPIDN